VVRGTFSPARAWRPAVGARLARTLGLMSNRPIYLRISPEDAACEVGQPEPARVVLVSAVATTQRFKESVAKKLAQGNCLYFMAWGSECEAWHDAVDMANIEGFDFKAIPEHRFIMTTWHEREPLSEALCFCKHNAFHPSVELRRTVILHVSDERNEQFLRLYAEA